MSKSANDEGMSFLAGTNSYVLFTLDKLIAKVLKAFQGLMQDPLSIKLFEMYKYECSRSVPFDDAVYHANVHVVLHEDHCFRVQSQPDGQLSIQMLDPDKTEVPASKQLDKPHALQGSCSALQYMQTQIQLILSCRCIVCMGN